MPVVAAAATAVNDGGSVATPRFDSPLFPFSTVAAHPRAGSGGRTSSSHTLPWGSRRTSIWDRAVAGQAIPGQKPWSLMTCLRVCFSGGCLHSQRPGVPSGRSAGARARRRRQRARSGARRPRGGRRRNCPVRPVPDRSAADDRDRAAPRRESAALCVWLTTGDITMMPAEVRVCHMQLPFESAETTDSEPEENRV